MLSVPMWAGPTHTIDGYNLVFVLQWPLLIGGVALTALGLALFVLAALEIPLGWFRSAPSLARP